MPETSLANRFADYANRLHFEDLPAVAVHEAKCRFIDSIATAVGAMSADAYAIARRCALRVASQPDAGLFGGGRSSPEWAAFVNGLLIRYLDYNDTYLSLEPAHPSDNLAPVLAVGDMLGCGGKDLIVAAVLAYEVQCRLCDAASLRQNGFDHVTYGAISSCLAACKLMGLDPAKTTHAVGIAGVCNTALRQTRAGELSMWKGCAFANAARNGVFTALLAAEGMTGPAPIFEGELGLMKLVTRTPFYLPALGGEDGQPFMINQTYIKFWPAEYHSQSAIDAALQACGRRSATCGKFAPSTFTPSTRRWTSSAKTPKSGGRETRETADHSLPYCTAVALIDGDVTDAQFAPTRFTEPAVVELTGKVQVHRDAGLSRAIRAAFRIG